MHFRSSESKANQRQVIHAYAQRVRRPLAAGIHFACTDRLMRSNSNERRSVRRMFPSSRLSNKPDISNTICICTADFERRQSVDALEKGKPTGDQTNSETELEGFSPSSNLICKHVNGSKGGVTRRWPRGCGDTIRCDVMRCDVDVMRCDALTCTLSLTLGSLL